MPYFGKIIFFIFNGDLIKNFYFYTFIGEHF